VAVTPSGLDYKSLTPALVGGARTGWHPGRRPTRPTSEAADALGIYNSTSARAIVHTHSSAAAALSCVVDEVPAVHYYLALLGGRVLVAPYAPFGSAELAVNVNDALGDRAACLLGNHGAVTVGDDLAQAYQRAGHPTGSARSLCGLSTGRQPKCSLDEQLATAAESFARYGQTDPGATASDSTSASGTSSSVSSPPT